MSNLHAMLKACSNGKPPSVLYVDDVFSAAPYVGAGGGQTVTNGMDLATKGGLVWVKNRGTTNGHVLWDTNRGINDILQTQLNSAQANLPGWLSSFNSNGFTVGSASADYATTLNMLFASWTFCQAAKFFDIIEYTGNAASNSIAHNLTVKPGMLWIKRKDSAEDWIVVALEAGGGYSVLDWTTAAALSTGQTLAGTTSTHINVNEIFGTGRTNTSGGAYIMYAIAHDTSAEGIVRCGSFVSGAGDEVITLGWEPQAVWYKRASASGGAWSIADQSRGVPTIGASKGLVPGSTAAEAGAATLNLNATGFRCNIGSTSDVWVYMAIRMPNKPPTSGAEVFSATARTGNSLKVTSGIRTDMVMISRRTGTPTFYVYDRKRNITGENLLTQTTDAEATTYTMGLDFIDGYKPQGVTPLNITPNTYIDFAFKRAPGVFDVVAYNQLGANTEYNHSLGVAPELMIYRTRAAANWNVSYKLTATDHGLTQLNSNAGGVTYTYASATRHYQAMTATTFNLSPYSAGDSIAYLFATKAGVSKVFSFTGNGTTQTINCGFSTGARFVLLKNITTTGDWIVWDSTRGIVAGDDPWLRLNTTSAENTTQDGIDPDSTGFIVNAAGTMNPNTSAQEYIGFAVAI